MRVEIRSDSAVIEGYVNAVGRDSRVLRSPTGNFVEQIVPKTFERALERAGKVELKLDHERVIGGTDQGNLELWEDNIGLYARAVVTDGETIQKAREKKLRGWSFAFENPVQRMEPYKDEIQRRYIEDLDLKEVTIVDDRKIPAYYGTSIEARDSGVIEYREFLDGTVEIRTMGEPPNHRKADTSTFEKEIEILEMEDHHESIN